MTIAIKAKEFKSLAGAMIDTTLTVFHQPHDVTGFQVGSHFIDAQEATRLGRYLLDIPEGHGILVLPLAEPVETLVDEYGVDA